MRRDASKHTSSLDGNPTGFVPEQLLQEFERYWDTGEWYAALHRAATLYSARRCLSGGELERLRRRIKGEDAEHVLADVQVCVTREVERIRRVVSIGERYDPDEILLVLTLRIQLELLDQLLREFLADCIGTLPENLFQGADDELLAMLGRRDLRTVVSSARKQIRKNWGAPITSAWLVDS